MVLIIIIIYQSKMLAFNCALPLLMAIEMRDMKTEKRTYPKPLQSEHHQLHQRQHPQQHRSPYFSWNCPLQAVAAHIQIHSRHLGHHSLQEQESHIQVPESHIQALEEHQIHESFRQQRGHLALSSLLDPSCWHQHMPNGCQRDPKGQSIREAMKVREGEGFVMVLEVRRKELRMAAGFVLVVPRRELRMVEGSVLVMPRRELSRVELVRGIHIAAVVDNLHRTAVVEVLDCTDLEERNHRTAAEVVEKNTGCSVVDTENIGHSLL